MQSIVDYSMMMAPTQMPQHHQPSRRAQKMKRELRRQAALEDEDIDLCSSPTRRQLPPRNEKMDALKGKLEGLHERLNKIESKMVLLDHNQRQFLRRPKHLSTIYECEDEACGQEQ